MAEQRQGAMIGMASMIMAGKKADMAKVMKAMGEDKSCLTASVFAGRVDQDYVA